jgi:hypothetical protein
MARYDLVTPDNVESLGVNQVFVFGSNESGRHGKGAAKTAMTWGAVYGQASGIQGKTYGIPTVNASISNKLPLNKIRRYVDEFTEFAKHQTELEFLVTEIGCGLAGHKHKDIAPMFEAASILPNVLLPRKFWRVLAHNAEIKGAR